nr:right-handed parallel beta-helix repeat-containing protein [Ardenticatenales bacterium]
DCIIVNNTFYENDTEHQGYGEIGLQFDTQNNRIQNNIFYANSQSLFIGNNYTQNSGSTVDYNLYFASAGVGESVWQWKAESYQGLAAYQAGTGNDTHSLFLEPGFVDAAQANFHLQPDSSAIDRGQSVAGMGLYDIDGLARVVGATVDIGADEHSAGLSLYLPVLRKNN